jgi:hypothetical protein
MVSDLWVTTIGTQPDCWISNSGQIIPFGISLDLGGILSWSPQKLWIPKLLLMNSASHWLLIRPILTHSLVVTAFWSQVTVLNWFGQIEHWNEMPALGAQDGWNLAVLHYGFCSQLAQLFDASITTTMVTTVQRQHSCGVSGLSKNYLFNGLKPENGFRTWRGLWFLRLPYCLVD